ncbi:MAG: hypothetical protein VX794_00520 [Nitrospinota bacterium]|nr:hypothetical protein [Nitrospinota bacterium]
MYEIMISSLSGMFLFLLIHITLWRISPSNTPRMSLLFLLVIIGIVCSVIVHSFFFNTNIVSIASTVWMDIFFIICYLFLYAGLSRSVSLTLLEKISKSKSINFLTLVKDYESSIRFLDRMDLMEKNGYIKISDDMVTIEPKGRRLISITKMFGRLVGVSLEG